MFKKKRLRDVIYDEEKIEGLIRQNYADIYKYCFYHVGNRETAQDLTQDVFLKFLSRLDDYYEYGKLKNYLYIVAKHAIADYFRRPKEVSLDEVEEKTSDDGMEKIPVRVDILQVLNLLDSFEKELIILRYYQDLRIKDIAQILDMPVSTIRYKIKKAEMTIKNKLDIGDQKYEGQTIKKKVRSIRSASV